MPRVSVLMPVYNTRPEHLREAIDSILAQTFGDFEFLILNDCSTNADVADVVKSYADPRIVYAENERNLGISGARNRLLDMAQGEYLAVMDHDDISLPDRFEKQVAFLDAHPDVGVVGTLVKNLHDGKVRPRPSDDVSIKKMLMIQCDLSHPSCMLRRSVLEKHHIRYEEMFSPAEDYALFARLIPVTTFAILPEALLHYRAWKGNASHSKAKAMEAAAYGVHAFMRRDNPELWAMAQAHLVRMWRYRFCGIVLLTREQTFRETTWKLFGLLPLWRVKEALQKFR
ncbi:glycosyltransferase family 2 protein [Mailhella sp.]|uniref:glycosyltransferase family 2 protein n=1 Tax=Mailhella sp. TaxID=1981029 RepID=UPI004063EA18